MIKKLIERLFPHKHTFHVLQLWKRSVKYECVKCGKHYGVHFDNNYPLRWDAELEALAREIHTNGKPTKGWVE